MDEIHNSYEDGESVLSYGDLASPSMVDIVKATLGKTTLFGLLR